MVKLGRKKMINHNVDVTVIGAGPAGLAAAVSASEHGAGNILLIDRNSWIGGILPQCIHDGFGVEETGHSMTGPEYVDMYIDMAKKKNINILTETMVLKLNRNLNITAVNKDGLHNIKTKSIVLATGCREKTRWNALIPGDRPSGIYTAGVAQSFINFYNIMPARNVVILGSGDVGLIMARRLRFEGANVLGVVEILPFASGLPRNVVQCLDDYDIPLFLNHTITYIKGKGRLESVTIAQIDEKMNIVSGSEKEIKCDTLLLSLGLIPENELSKDVGITIDNITGGPVVNQNFGTSLPGVFACGNCLQVYDTVDSMSIDAKHAGTNAAKYSKKKANLKLKVVPGKEIRYIIPQVITAPGKIRFTLRVEKPKLTTSYIHFVIDSKEIFKKKLPYINPANIIEINVDVTQDLIKSNKKLEVVLSE